MNPHQHLPQFSQRLGVGTEDLLSPAEWDAIASGAGAAVTWAIAMGRIIRAWTTPPEVSRVARRTCGQLADITALQSLGVESTDAMRSLERDIAAVAARSRDARSAWRALSLRDDLESVMVAIAAIVRFAPDDRDSAFVDRVSNLERRLSQAIHAIDERSDAIVDEFADTMRQSVDEPIVKRILAVSRDPAAGPWIALALGASHSTAKRSPIASGDITRAAERPVRLAPRLFQYAAPATAAANDEILEALEAAADSEPVASLDDGRVVVRVCIPADSAAQPDRGVSGLAVESTESYDAITDVRIESDDGQIPPPRRIPPLAWWISLRPLAPAKRFAIVVKTDRGSFRCVFERQEDSAT
jgi:hypothetical protein